MQSESLWYLQAVPVLSLWRGGGAKTVSPSMGFRDSGQWSVNTAYFAVFTQGYLKRKDARDEVLIYAQ